MVDFKAYATRGVLAMLGYLGMCHFPGYNFCPKILKQTYFQLIQKINAKNNCFKALGTN